MTELEKHLLEALEQAQAQQQQRKPIYSRCSSTKQDNQSVREAFKKLLENISETDQTRNELEQISSASKQLELSSARLQDTKQSLDRAITGIRNASQQVKEMNEPKKVMG